MRLFYRLACALFLMVVGAAPISAQSYPGADRSDATQAGFGAAVAVVERDVLVGEGGSPLHPGVVHIYRKDASGVWTIQEVLNASDASGGDGFGAAMAQRGNRVLVKGQGGIYVFEKSGMQWNEIGLIAIPEGAASEGFGAAMALEGDVAIIGAAQSGRRGGPGEGIGAAYLFRRTASGDWLAEGRVVGSTAEERGGFGSSVAIYGDEALVGSSGQGGGTGAVYLFRRDGSGVWGEAGQISTDGMSSGDGFGASIVIGEEGALIGATGVGQVGALFVFDREDDGGLSLHSRLFPFDGTPRAGFGGSVAAGPTDIWVGAPGFNGSAGAAYVFGWSEDADDWTGAQKVSLPELDPRDRFGGAMAGSGDVVVVGVSGDDYGEGSAVIYERTASGAWESSPRLITETTMYDAIVEGQVDCSEGSAALFGCDQVDLVSFLPVHEIGGDRGVRVNDVWGWEDPTNGREYALVGRLDGTSFVDITNAANPVYIGNLPKPEGTPSSTWRDIKVFKDHAFIVADGAGAHGVQVFDLTRLRNFRGEPEEFTMDAHYTRIFSAHNIVINEDTGFAYTVGNSRGGETCGGGSHMIDINDPTNPEFAGCWAHGETGRRGTGYTHDGQCVVYNGPDTEHQGREVCFGANETALSIADVTDKSAPVALSKASYPNVAYTHQGWLSDDHSYFYINDELDELSNEFEGTRTLIWDVTDLDDPQLVKEHFGETRATDHNLYIRGNLMYQSNYRAGLRIMDISDPENPVEVGYFDTVPYGDNGPGMGGSWSNYPFFKSGTIIVTSGSEGLFIVKKKAPIS